jgi:phospho-N-acetylmuramoyl-pentapeptide-transferase
MIYFLGKFLHPRFELFSFLRLVDYITARAIGAALTAIILTLIITPMFIRYLHRHGLVDQWRDTGVASVSDNAGPRQWRSIVTGCVLLSCLLCAISPTAICWQCCWAWGGLIYRLDDTAKIVRSRAITDFRIEELLPDRLAAALVAHSASPFSPRRFQMSTFIPFQGAAV